jgi:hypothetical protein
MTEYCCAICGQAHADRGDRLACCSDRPLPGDAIADAGRRCHDRAGSALLDLDQTHLGEFSADWRPTRSLNPGRRTREDSVLQRPGRTDRGGRASDD